MLQEIIGFFQKLFDTSDFPARWHCGRWTDFHGWLYILSDLMIWSAYFAIPLLLFAYTRKKEVPFHRIFFLFGAFILACGLTHLLDALIFWLPVYRLSALVRLFTGIISWVTVFAILRTLPIAFAMRTPADFEKEIVRRKATEAALEKSNHILNLAQQIGKIGHWEWKLEEMERVYGSAEFFHIYNLKPEEDNLPYQDFLQRIYPEDREYVITNWQKAMQEGLLTTFYHRIMDTEEQTIVQVLVRGDVMRDENGTINRLIGTVQDVTQIKKTEEELLQKTHDLEVKVAELQRFAFLASHDLKEPLRKISLFASKFQTQFGADIPEKGAEYLAKIQENATRQQQLVDEVLELSRLSNTTLNLERVSLKTVAEAALTDLEVLVLETATVVEMDDLPEAWVAPGQIKLLFQNLFSNAIKFRHSQRPPFIKVTAEIIRWENKSLQPEMKEGFTVLNDPNYRNREKYVKITLRDNGIGFEPTYQDSIFQIFKRLHGREYEGTGLGLAICKRIVDNHRGDIEAKGFPNEGAAFFIILPLGT